MRSEIPFSLQDREGNALNGTAHVYLRGTTTDATVYAGATGSATIALPIPVTNGVIPGWVDEGAYDLVATSGPATFSRSWNSVAYHTPPMLDVTNYGAVGNGSTDDAVAINAALTVAGVSGGIVYLPNGLNFKFASTLVIPAGVVLQLGMGTTLSCAVTGGVDGITVGAGSIIKGSGGGGSGGSGGALGSTIKTISGAVIDALITNAAPNQEYIYLRDLFITANAGSTVRSLVDYIGVYYNSGIERCVLDSANVATNCLRIRSSGSTQFGQLRFAHTWFNRATQDCVLIEGAGASGGGSVSGSDIWFEDCLFENWGIGTDASSLPTGGLKITAPTGVINNVHVHGGHFENGSAAGSASQCIYAQKVIGLAVEQVGLFFTSPTNYSGVVWTNNTENQGGRIINLFSTASLTSLVNDGKRAITINDSTCDVYYQAGRNTSTFFFPNNVTALTYSASITPDALKDGSTTTINVTNTTAFTINAPTNPIKGRELTFDIKNTSGGAMGTITWNAVFLLAGAFTNPATGKRRTIKFYYDGTNWVELFRAAADI